MIDWDVFISHASEDKASVARPLADKLASHGITTWLDEAEISIGDHLRDKIDEGLRHSQFGLVVLSPSFFKKDWPRTELDGLLAREGYGDKVILPIWHNLTHCELRDHSAVLAGRVGISTEQGLDEVTKKVIEAIMRSGRKRTTGRSIYAGKLTKKMLLRLPVGSVIITNSIKLDLTPTWIVEIGTLGSREQIWRALRDSGEAGRTCYVFKDMGNMRAHLAAGHNWIPEAIDVAEMLPKIIGR